MKNLIRKGSSALPIVVAGVFVMAIFLLPSIAHASTTYGVESYSNSNYNVEKNDFFQGDTVYGKGTSSSNQYLKLVFRNPVNNTIVKDCDWDYGKSTKCTYSLPNNAPIGEWDIQLFRWDDDNWEYKLLDHFNVSSPTGSISGTKWNDKDGDKNWDGSEPALADWTIQLKNNWDDANPITETVTTVNGYAFNDVPFGTYWICETQQDHWIQTTPYHNHGCYQVTLDSNHRNLTGKNFGNQYVPYCGDGIVNNKEQCDEGPDGGKTCTSECSWKPATINTQKVVCENEADLPNSGVNSFLKPISASTAQDWVKEHDGCKLVDWTFQWRPDNTDPYNPGDNYTDNNGVAGGAWSSPFSNSVDVSASLSKIWLREVWNDQYIPFAYEATQNSSNVSAEFYCNTDVLNYDNLEWVDNLKPGQDYYCVGFNVKKTYCGDDIVNQETEQCDGNSQVCTTPDGYTGTQSCNMPNQEETFRTEVVSNINTAPTEPLFCTWNPCVTTEKCGDSIKNGNEVCDGTDGVGPYQNCLANCTLENVPYCGDGIKNGMEQCDGTDGITGSQTCSSACEIVNPTTAVILQLTKTVDKSLANPNDTLTYTITVKNTGTSDASNVILTDTLPAGLTFLDDKGNNTGNTTNTWTWTTIAVGASQTATFKVHVDSSASTKAYVNNASVKADGFNAISAQATTNVTLPKVLGEEAPALTITKAVDVSFVNPSGTANYTVVITNTGGSPAKNVVLTDVLPAGFTFVDNGKATNTWTLGDLVPTEQVTKTYKVKADAAVTPGKYINTASAKADNVSSVSAQATLEVRSVQVLGAEEILPVTGQRFMNYFYFIAAGLIALFSLVVFKFTSSKD